MQKDILITGASGYVGARLYYDLSKEKFKVSGTYNSQQLSEEFEKLDITDKDAVRALVRLHKPAYIVHSAANASSGSCNKNPVSAILTNEKGTQNIVDAANEEGTTVIYISALVAEYQHSIYEQTKYKGEELVRGAKAGYIILRPSVVYGMSSNTTTDKPFNQILRNIDGKYPKTYDASWLFQPTWIGHISEIIAVIIDRDVRNQEIPVIVPENRSKFAIANDLLQKFGIRPDAVSEKSHRESKSYSTESLKALGLPTHHYNEIIDRIAEEIKNREKYII